MNRSIWALATAAIVGVLVVGVAQPSFAEDIQNGGAMSCGPDSKVKISWTSTGPSDTRAYWKNSSGAWSVGPWNNTNNGSWTTATRSVAGWQVIANGTITSASASCV